MKKNNEQNELSLQYLEQLAKKRTGGAINLRGINFQVLYSVSKILEYLQNDVPGKHIRLEGIEDLDLNTPQLELDSCQYIQLKSSQNSLNASTFWTMGVLQNFLEVYAVDPSSQFKLVHNMNIKKGSLAELATRNLTGKNLTYWTDKLNNHIAPRRVDLVNFLNSISFEQIDVETLMTNIICELRSKWGVNLGTENIFLRSLFYHVFNWSIERKRIFHNDLVNLFTEVRDAFSKAPVNEALKNDWLSEISFTQQSGINLNDYFDGKACRPIHVANGLPARRKKWEKEVFDSFTANDITLIRSSSGQGKSTIAWQVSHNLNSIHHIYQLNSCNNWEQVNALIELLTSRVQQGLLPVIVIDGLSAQTKDWGILADKTSDLPIKYLLTSRYEDWQRYGADLSRLSIKIIDIFLTHVEAKDVFLQLKSKGKISAEIHAWEPVWELVQEKGLLIEYTFLLTRGQMIHERLAYQIKTLNKDDSPLAKIEILRIIALADCLQLSIETKKLLQYINYNIGFSSDRGNVLQSLENEYFVSFDHKNVIGLHPVRSQHLTDLLHKYVGIEETLIKIYPLIHENLRYDFFINAPLLLQPEEAKMFYEHFADYLSNGDYAEMVTALDGVIHSEPQRYWINNRSVFDEAFESGGIDLFIMNSIPFQNFSAFKNLADTLPSDMKAALNHLLDKQKQLSTFSLKETDVYKFAAALSKAIKIRERKNKSFIGLEFLTLWFKKLDIEFNIDLEIDAKEMIDIMRNSDFQQTTEIFSTLKIQRPVQYENFLKSHKSHILSFLKVKTDTPTLYEDGNKLMMEYILTGDEAEKANELSVKRIDEVYSFLPGYQRYCTDAIMLPFPNTSLISAVLQNAHKEIPPENIPNNFDVHLNQIWISVISDNYKSGSAYEWQSNIIEFRKINLQYVRNISQYIESLIEGRVEKAEIHAIQIDTISRSLNLQFASSKKYPSFERKSFRIEKYAEQEKVVKNWQSALSNVRSQIVNLFNAEDQQKQNLVLINFKNAFLNLNNMQQAFKEMETGSFSYFQTEDLVKSEIELHNRLYCTMMYYIAHIPLEAQKAVHVGKRAVADWWKGREYKDLSALQAILKQLSETSDFKFYPPLRLKETYTLTYATFAVEGNDLSDSERMEALFVLLAPLADIPVDFFTIVRVQEGVTMGAFRVQKDFFIQIKNYLDGYDSDLSNLTPILQIPDKEMIADIPGISLSKVNVNLDKEALVLCLFKLWKISEYKQRLDPSSEMEQNWLNAIVSKHISEIKSHLITISNKHSNYQNWINWIEVGLVNGVEYSSEEINEKLLEIVIE